VSTRRVDHLVQAMGLSGISQSKVSQLCKEIEERAHVCLDRPLVGDGPYLWPERLEKKGSPPPWVAGRGGAVVIAMFGRLNSPGQESSVSGIGWRACTEKNGRRRGPSAHGGIS
jgi:hypothetical protein